MARFSRTSRLPHPKACANVCFAMRKLSISLGSSPIMSALFAGVFAIGFSLNAVASDSSSKAKGKTPPAPPPVVIPSMEASGSFFANTLAVEVHFGRVPRPQLTASGTGVPDSATSGGGGKGGGRRGGRGGFHGGGSSRRESSGEDLGDYSGDPLMRGVPDAGDRRMNIRAENNPSTQLRLVFTNHGTAPVVIEVLDFNSILGDFAVKPDKITVAPGATVEAEPMISRLGIPTEDVPIKVRLSNGSTSEQQTLVLKMSAGSSEIRQN